MPKQIKYMTHRLHPWKHDVLVLVGGTELDAERVVQRFLKVSEITVSAHSDVIGRAWRPDGQPTAIWVRSLDLVDLPVLLHEIIHAVSHILRLRGMELSEGSEEAYTYTAEDLFRAVLTNRRWTRA